MDGMKPSAITGEAVFTSYDGLRAEANGILSFLTFDRKPLEMRSERILSALMPEVSGDSAIFLQWLMVQGENQFLIGLVRKITDFNKRPGIIGACISMPETSQNLEHSMTYILDYLFPLIENATTDQWAGKPLPEQLGLLNNVPKREVKVEYQFKKETKLLHQDEASTVKTDEAIQTGIDLIGTSKKIGRVILLPTQTRGTKPVDRQFVESVHAEVEQLRAQAERTRQQTPATRRQTSIPSTSPEEAVQTLIRQENHTVKMEKASGLSRKPESSENSPRKPSSMAEVLRRQENLDQRLARIEKKLAIKRQGQNPKGLPIDRSLYEQHEKANRHNVVVLAVGAVLTVMLIVLLAIWLFMGSTKPTFEREIKSTQKIEADASSTATVESEAEDPETVDVLPNINCENPQSFADQTVCEKPTVSRQ